MSFQYHHFIYTPPQEPLVTVYEDEDLLIIDKPAGLLSVPGRLPEHRDSAYSRVLSRHPAAKITHRLDMATSGLLMFAKHRNAEVAMSKMFQARLISKHYLAWVQGRLEGEGCVEVPLMTDWPYRPRQKVDFETGKAAKTLYQSLAYHAKDDLSHIRLTPVTGRSHQLRVHMQYLGHPIMGDKLYHPDPAGFYLNRMALHASELSFRQPLSGEVLDIRATAAF